MSSSSSHHSRTRLFIADDNKAIRYLLKLLAEAECDIVGEAATALEAIQETERLQPDVLLMDLSMPGMSGFDAARYLLQRMPGLRIIIASQHTHASLVQEAFSLGIRGYLVKEAANSELLVAIREVCAGHCYRSPLVPA